MDGLGGGTKVKWRVLYFYPAARKARVTSERERRRGREYLISCKFPYGLKGVLWRISLQYDTGTRVVSGDAAGEALEAADRKRTGMR